jgi:hypothetical protein
MRSMKSMALVAGLLAAPVAFAQTSGTSPAQPGTTAPGTTAPGTAGPMTPATPANPGARMTTPPAGGGTGMATPPAGTGTGMATPPAGTGTGAGTGMGMGGAATTAPGATTGAPGTRSEGPPTTTTPVAGANSFTESQARSRIEDAGYTNVQGLAKDDQGVWRGKAMRNGTQSDVGLDFRGNVVTGNAPAR